MSIRNEFDRELNKLHNEVLKMGSVIEETLNMTIEALKNRSISVLEEIIRRDDIIDQYESDIERSCLNMIIRQQPVAADLRAIASVLKIITDMERIADQSSDIAEYMIQIIQKGCRAESFDLTDILHMASRAKDMVVETIECYVNLDVGRAIEISQRDDEIDRYFSGIAKNIEQKMKENGDFIFEGICYLYIIKYIERIADHSTNICEWVAYRVTGEHNSYN